MARDFDLFSRAQKVIPGGVNSPVRAWRGVSGEPLFIERGEGPYIYSNGKRYLDYVGSWGPLILGHCHPRVLAAIHRALELGTSFGAPTAIEVEFAELLVRVLPNCVEQIRFVSSGTEATMTALRLARGITGRKRIIKFNGCYHGHSDSLLVAAGSGVATLGVAGSKGVPEEIAELTVSVEFNDLELLEKTFETLGAESIAAVIIEPVVGNSGLILPENGFLQGVERLCQEHGAFFIVDEVMTGFRVALGGATERYSLNPDLITYGKIIGGGLPVGAVAGRRETMEQLAPTGPVYQAGTLSGNPLAMAAGMETVKILIEESPYERLEQLGVCWRQGFSELANKFGVPLIAEHCGSMVGLFFSENRVRNFAEAKLSNIERFNKFFHAMIEKGIYLAPSAFEAGFISVMHTPELIQQTIDCAADALSLSSLN